MNNYIDSNYYYDIYSGTIIPQKEIDKYCTEASNKVRYKILNKSIKDFEYEVKQTTCLVADILYNQNLKKQKLENILNGTEKIISSEKVGDYSRNLSSISINDLKSSIEADDKRIEEEMETNLLFTGLLYSGAYDVR